VKDFHPIVKAEPIRPLRTEAVDYNDTEKLKADIRALREKRAALFLTKEEPDPNFMRLFSPHFRFEAYC
jgi:hypothetical protein